MNPIDSEPGMASEHLTTNHVTALGATKLLGYEVPCVVEEKVDELRQRWRVMLDQLGPPPEGYYWVPEVDMEEGEGSYWVTLKPRLRAIPGTPMNPLPPEDGS